MPIGLLIIETLFFGVALWLGIYLISRDFSDLLLRYAGLGLVVYALIPAIDMLQSVASANVADILIRVQYPLVLLPATFWSVAMLYLLPDTSEWRNRISERRINAILLGDLIIIGVAAATDLVFDFSGDEPEAGLLYILFAVFVAVSLGGLLLITLRANKAEAGEFPAVGRTGGVLMTAGLFFALGVAILLLPLEWIPRELFMVGVGFDLILFGASIAVFDSFAQGETLRGDMLRSFLGSGAMALVFGGQIGLMMGISTGVTAVMVVLMLAASAASIVIYTQAGRFSRWIDAMAFPRESQVRRQRELFSFAAETVGRINPSVGFDMAKGYDEEEFARLTRRALSNYGNLPRLATSPLTRLPLIEARLKARQAPDNTLERANELKTVLTESIDRLKPRGEDGGNRRLYGITDEWRYYNVLYYPYVMGIKPFSRRLFSDTNGQDDELRTVMDWFQADVPQRTFYNWQNAAARLVAQDIRERSAER